MVPNIEAFLDRQCKAALVFSLGFPCGGGSYDPRGILSRGLSGLFNC
jgi:hypothetical protein